ncbi:MAG: type II secretion system GspH family protein [Ruminococcus sp.]|nr:type II secretion system GspH family protein [Ruminococcus sp.]
MKTTKKGFTLIELIVVIAIIGVLAAILVPSMLGYVKKSKIQGANSTASTLAKAANSAVTDLDEEDIIVADGTCKNTNCTSEDTPSSDGKTAAASATIADSIQTFFNDFEKGGTNMAVEFKDGVCVAAAVQSGNYYGTYPAYFTAKNWDKYKDNVKSVDNALAKAVEKATGTTATPSTGG